MRQGITFIRKSIVHFFTPVGRFRRKALIHSIPLFSLLLLSFLLATAPVLAAPLVDLGPWQPASLEQLQQQANRLLTPGERVAKISDALLGTPYVADTLHGGLGIPEKLVFRLDGVDCFTFLDSVEALRRSADVPGLLETLKTVRYFDGQVDYLSRKHFFSDWGEEAGGWLQEVTAAVGGKGQVIQIEKQLNRKTDGSLYLAGYPVRSRQLSFIPAERINPRVLERLQDGDYVGFVSEAAGLDVSHCGILVRKKGVLYLRHASSDPDRLKVVDQELVAYLQDVPGIMIFRPQEPRQGK